MRRSPGQPDAPPTRRIVIHPLTTWRQLIKQELIACGVGHDQAGLISRRILSALVPQQTRLEATDNAGLDRVAPK